MTPRLLLKAALVSILFFGCSKPLPTLKDFDQQTWKQDKNACGNKRFDIVNTLESQKEKLLALDEMEIVELLGKPDQNELYKRNQKFYYYFIQPAAKCIAGDSVIAQKLVVRFNAMGLAKEISIE